MEPRRSALADRVEPLDEQGTVGEGAGETSASFAMKSGNLILSARESDQRGRIRAKPANV